MRLTMLSRILDNLVAIIWLTFWACLIVYLLFM